MITFVSRASNNNVSSLSHACLIDTCNSTYLTILALAGRHLLGQENMVEIMQTGGRDVSDLSTESLRVLPLLNPKPYPGDMYQRHMRAQ